MIYEFPNIQRGIRQGDIFRRVPRVEVELSSGLSILNEKNELFTSPWEELVQKQEDVVAIFGVVPVTAIVISQTCDATTAPYITLCEVVELSEIDQCFATQKALKNEVKEIMRKNREKPNLFYLPPNQQIGFTTKMGVDFRKTIRINREDLDGLKKNRCGCLNSVAYDHFREKLSYFFHRYAFNEWYPLSKEEVQCYENINSLSDSDIFDWQK